MKFYEERRTGGKLGTADERVRGVRGVRVGQRLPGNMTRVG